MGMMFSQCVGGTATELKAFIWLPACLNCEVLFKVVYIQYTRTQEQQKGFESEGLLTASLETSKEGKAT